MFLAELLSGLVEKHSGLRVRTHWLPVCLAIHLSFWELSCDIISGGIDQDGLSKALDITGWKHRHRKM